MTLHCDVPNLWKDYQEQLFYFIIKRVKDEQTAKDIHHDVLIKVYKFCMTRSGVNNVRAWLYKITYNTIIDFYKKQSLFSDAVVSEIPEFDEEDTIKEAALYMEPLINLLPKKYAVPLKMADLQQISQKEVARELGLGLSATKSRIQRGRKKLQEQFIECCIYQTDRQGNIIDFKIKDNCTPLLRYQKDVLKK
jgi:RNA polymerase sigma-70 factor (ECF subfamily)